MSLNCRFSAFAFIKFDSCNRNGRSPTVFVFSTHFAFLGHLTEVQGWERRSSIFATSPAAGRFTGRRLISELTCAGTAERDPSSATGCSAGRGSPGATSCKDTGGHTQVRRCFNKSLNSYTVRPSILKYCLFFFPVVLLCENIKLELCFKQVISGKRITWTCVGWVTTKTKFIHVLLLLSVHDKNFKETDLALEMLVLTLQLKHNNHVPRCRCLSLVFFFLITQWSVIRASTWK